jgi:hypothetical protein
MERTELNRGCAPDPGGKVDVTLETLSIYIPKTNNSGACKVLPINWIARGGRKGRERGREK